MCNTRYYVCKMVLINSTPFFVFYFIIYMVLMSAYFSLILFYLVLLTFVKHTLALM